MKAPDPRKKLRWNWHNLPADHRASPRPRFYRRGPTLAFAGIMAAVVWFILTPANVVAQDLAAVIVFVLVLWLGPSG